MYSMRRKEYLNDPDGAISQKTSDKKNPKYHAKSIKMTLNIDKDRNLDEDDPKPTPQARLRSHGPQEKAAWRRTDHYNTLDSENILQTNLRAIAAMQKNAASLIELPAH